MATKAYTNLGQSKVLALFLPIESADMYYDRGGLPSLIDKYVTHESIKNDEYHHLIPCWSLAALMEIIRTKSFNRQSGFFMGKTEPYCVFCGSECQTKVHNEPVDACYEMILKLNQLKKL